MPDKDDEERLDDKFVGNADDLKVDKPFTFANKDDEKDFADQLNAVLDDIENS